MTYRGQIKNGAIVLDGAPDLPEGTRVVVETVPADQQAPSEPNSLAAFLLKFAGTCKGLPSDFARNHDHYIHGQPKK